MTVTVGLHMLTKNIISNFLVVSLFTSLFVSAAPVTVDMTNGVWTISAADTGGNDWSGSILRFETQVADNNNSLLSGFFEWTSDTGFFGRENFTGTLFLDRSLQLDGFELVPPSNGIILGQYFADLALSNNDIVDGTWQTNVHFLPTNVWTASRAVVPVSAAVWLFSSGLPAWIDRNSQKEENRLVHSSSKTVASGSPFSLL